MVIYSFYRQLTSGLSNHPERSQLKIRRSSENSSGWSQLFSQSPHIKVKNYSQKTSLVPTQPGYLLCRGHFIYLFIFFYSHLRTCSLILERGEGRERQKERKTLMQERNNDCLLYLTQPGTKATTQVCALTGNRNPDRQHSNQLSFTGQGQGLF